MNDLLSLALDEFGVKEIVGKEHSQRVLQYAKDLGWKWVTTDEIPWCSVFMNWIAMKGGYIRSNSAAARSWLKVGELISKPEKGCVVVFKRGNSTWQGHVALYINEMGNKTNVLGGNQSNQVKISPYNTSSILGYIRLPKIAG